MAANDPIEEQIQDRLCALRQSLVTAESCTGGMIAQQLTAMAGASHYFRGGVVVYSNRLKEQLLGVRPETLIKYGAVSEQVAKEMAEGARHRLDADYAIAVTGIAGPGGGTPDKPVGLVFIATASPKETRVADHIFPGSRAEIRQATTSTALWQLWEMIL